jgi:hypothetical protein
MSDWITLSLSDVYDYLAADQADALRTEALGDDQADPLPAIIADVVARIRAEVSGNSANTLDSSSGSIPRELRGAALALVVEAAQARIPVLKMTTDQIRLANVARTLLKRVAAGDLPISQGAATADDSGSVSKVVLVKCRANPLSGSSLGGL